MFSHVKRKMRPAAPRHAHRYSFGGAFACACVCACVYLCVCACVSFLLTLVIAAPLSHQFWWRFCVCLGVCVVVCLCPFRCRSWTRHSYLGNFGGTFVCVYLYDYVIVSFLLVIGIGLPLYRSFGRTFVCVCARANV